MVPRRTWGYRVGTRRRPPHGPPFILRKGRVLI
nr:MAG TPA: hypothetical protein [Caudoviricetes sp.]